ISVADVGANLNATDVEAALAEIADAFEGDHFRGNESNPGQHRTIRQPAFGGSLVLILDSAASGAPPSHLPIYAATTRIWFTLNHSGDGIAWVRDNPLVSCGGFRFSRYEIEFLRDDTFPPTFTTWSLRWKLPMSGYPNSAFELSGNMTEVGRCGADY